MRIEGDLSGKYSMWKISRPASSNWYILDFGHSTFISLVLYEKDRCSVLLLSSLSSFPSVQDLSRFPSGQISLPIACLFGAIGAASKPEVKLNRRG